MSNPVIPWDSIADMYDVYVQTGLDVPFFLDAARDIHGDILELMITTEPPFKARPARL